MSKLRGPLAYPLPLGRRGGPKRDARAFPALLRVGAIRFAEAPLFCEAGEGAGRGLRRMLFRTIPL
jgi:hypothetical protein